MKLEKRTSELSKILKNAIFDEYSTKPKIDNNDILLTGGAGFLGVHLLKMLCESRKYDKVYTILRSKEIFYKNVKFFKMEGDWVNKIQIIEGDLITLSEQEYPNVSTVIHSAARIHCVKTYKQLWRDNVITTKKVSEIYKNNQLYFISTLSVFVSSNIQGNHIQESVLESEKIKIYGGYAQTKYIGEKIIEQVSGKIIRPGLITGHKKYQIFPDDFFSMIIKTLSKLGVHPEGYEESFVDISPVDIVSNEIVNIVTKSESDERIFHIANTESASIDIFINTLNLKKVSREEWVRKLANENNIIKTLLNYAFFKSEMLKTHHDYFNIDLFQSTGHHYNIKKQMDFSNDDMVKLYYDKLIAEVKNEV